MADKRPLFMGAEGYSEEMAFTDEVQLGKVTINSGGTGIVMNGKPISGLPSSPGGDSNAASKAYVDSVAQGLKTKDPAVVVGVTADGNQTLSGLPILDGVETLVDGDRVLLTAQTSGIENGLWLVHGARAYLDLAVPGTLIDSVIEAIAGGTGGNSITMAFTADGTGVGSLTRSGTDFTFHYESAVTTVGDFEAAVAALTGGDRLIRVKTAGTSATALVAPGDTFTATNLASGSASAWTRPTDFAAGSHAGSSFVFIQAGTDYADTGWVCTSNAPADVVGTNSLAWVQFSSAGVVTAGAGLQKIGQVISVKKGDGIEVTSNGASTNVALSASNPCLTLAGTSPNKTLEVAVEAAGVGTGGIAKNATGLALDLDGTTLQLGAGGVSVKGLPNLFEIGGSATSQTPGTGVVTATNLNTLTAGAASNADALHTHGSSPATEAPKVENTLTVGEAIAVADPVYFTNTSNRIGKSDTVDPKAYVIGIARTAQPTPGSTCEVVTVGPCAGILGGTATAGDRYYLQDGGGIGIALPGSGKRVIQVGIAINTTDLFVRIVDFGKKAA